MDDGPHKKSAARVKQGKAAWAALSPAEKKRRLDALAAGRAKRGGGKTKKAKKSGTRKASGKPAAAKKTKKARKPGRPKGSTDKAPRKTRSDAGKKKSGRKKRKATSRPARKAPRKAASRKGGTKRRKSVAPNVRPHAGTAACESCGKIHTKRQHWSHTSGGHSGPTRHSYKCTRNNECSPSAKKRKAAPKRKTATKRKYSPPKDVFYKKNRRGEWVAIKGRSIPDPMTREMDFRGGTKRPYYKAKSPPKRPAAAKAPKKGKLQTLEQVKAAAIREKYNKKARKK